MRCENPAELGLTSANMLRGTDGKPIRRGRYFLLDYTQPEVQAGLRERARRFIRRYQPDLIKFDFGYEIPSLAMAAPRDMNYAGERMLLKGLEVVVEAMRQENPDIVLMYYSLSPLLNKYIDLHSPDDLYVNAGEYDLEANRRFYFSSVLAEIGMPTYGSGGYDWETMPAIWFDSALIGTLGSLQPLGVDERGATGTPERIAKFNGLSRLLRPASQFRIEVLGDRPVFAATRAAHATSWARYEGDELVGRGFARPRLGTSGHRGHGADGDCRAGKCRAPPSHTARAGSLRRGRTPNSGTTARAADFSRAATSLAEAPRKAMSRSRPAS